MDFNLGIELFNDIIDDGQHIHAVLVTFLKQMDNSQVKHLQGFSRRVFHCHTNMPGDASLTKPICLALSVVSWDELHCPIYHN